MASTVAIGWYDGSPKAAAMPTTANPPNAAAVTQRRWRATRPTKKPRMRATITVPNPRAALSALPKTWMAKSLTPAGTWSITQDPTADTAEGTVSVRPAMSSVSPTASPADTRPAHPAQVRLVAAVPGIGRVATPVSMR